MCCGSPVFLIFKIHIPEKEARFPNTRIPNKEQLEQVVTEIGFG